MRGVLIREWGGPEVLELADDLPEPEPGPGQRLIHVTACGVNFADTHARDNAYIAKYELPLVPGTEVAGTLDDGTRVVAMPHHGGYAEYAIADEQSIFPLPDALGDHEALALLIQGMTASAPSSVASARLSSLLALAITRPAPIGFASCSARLPVPPAAEWTTTVSPSRIWAAVR